MFTQRSSIERKIFSERERWERRCSELILSGYRVKEKERERERERERNKETEREGAHDKGDQT